MKRLLVAVALVFAFSLSIRAQGAGNVGSPQCGGVQRSVQMIIGDEDPNVYKNHGAYVSAVTAIVNQASQSGLISGQCSGCIINQFARRVPIANQTSCGPVTPPSQSCQQTNPTVQQVQTATLLALRTVDDPWNNAPQFQSLITLADEILGCKLEGPPLQPTFPQPVQPQTQQSATSGVNYCGPGNSNTNPFLNIVNVPECLNGSCFTHDTCYGINCVASQCKFTPQSQTCDDPLIATCEGRGSCPLTTILTSPSAIAVCAIAECLNGTFPDLRCIALRAARVLANPECAHPPSLETCNLACAGQTCGNFTTCNPTSGCIAPVCGSLAEGGGTCVEGATLCAGLADCTTSADCGGGLCFVGSCCGRPVCVNASAFCPNIGASPASATQRFSPLTTGPTIARP